MAVLEAVRGWEQISGLPHINDVKKNEDGGGEELPSLDDQPKISDEEVEHEIESTLKTNLVSLLMEHDEYVDQAQMSRKLLFRAPLLSFIDILASVEPFFLHLLLLRFGF